MDTNTVIPMGSSQDRGPLSMPVPREPKKNGSDKKGGMNWLWIIIGLLIFGGLWYFLISKPASVVAPSEEGEELMEENTGEGETIPTGDRPSFLWEFSPAGGSNETGAERTAITLSINGEARSVGTFDGSCLVINGSSWVLAPNELTGIICWFAGGGDEVGVFYENGQYVVKQGVIEEGAEGEAGLRGNYETLFAL